MAGAPSAPVAQAEVEEEARSLFSDAAETHDSEDSQKRALRALRWGAGAVSVLVALGSLPLVTAAHEH